MNMIRCFISAVVDIWIENFLSYNNRYYYEAWGKLWLKYWFFYSEVFNFCLAHLSTWAYFAVPRFFGLFIIWNMPASSDVYINNNDIMHIIIIIIIKLNRWAVTRFPMTLLPGFPLTPIHLYLLPVYFLATSMPPPILSHRIFLHSICIIEMKRWNWGNRIPSFFIKLIMNFLSLYFPTCIFIYSHVFEEFSGVSLLLIGKYDAACSIYIRCGENLLCFFLSWMCNAMIR